MKKFLDEDFLLNTPTARVLYHDIAEKLPIIDYHCHINPKEIFEDAKYDNIAQIWLYGDHYKWRCMRTYGIDEYYITGSASDYEKFLAFAKTLPRCIGNPMYHWSHLELKRYFGIETPLNEDTAEEIWEATRERLAELSCRKIIKMSSVEVICTTDDPADDLAPHRALTAEDCGFKVLPAFRPDGFMQPEREDFGKKIQRLSAAAGIEIRNFSDMIEALLLRMRYFHEQGCRVSDHALLNVPYAAADEKTLNAIFEKAIGDYASITPLESEQFSHAVLLELGKEYSRLGWAMQLHIGALRNNNTRMFRKLGPDSGFDSMVDLPMAQPLARLLDELDREECLPKTIMYTANPAYNYVISTMLGNFQGKPAGKMQFGSAWWFNDHLEGMRAQITALANTGLLSGFIGMLTDSRSFLSYTRHEYFRRLLCDIIGQWVEEGGYPLDMKYMKEIVEGICYYNAKRYLFEACRSAG